MYLEEPSPLFTNCSLYCTLYCCHYSCYSFHFSFLSHSFTVRTNTRSLTLVAHSHLAHAPHTHTPHTHTPHTHAPHALLHQWQLQMQETHRQNLNPLLFHWSRRCGSILDFQWVMLTKKPQFASSAETRWQVILFKFPIDWRCKLMLTWLYTET